MAKLKFIRPPDCVCCELMHTAQCQTGEVPFKGCPDDRNQQLLKAMGNPPTLSKRLIEMGYTDDNIQP